MVDWTRVVLGVLFGAVVLGLGLWLYQDFPSQYNASDPAVIERLEQIQQRLNDVEARVRTLEKQRPAAVAKQPVAKKEAAPGDLKQEAAAPAPPAPPKSARPQYQVSPPTAVRPAAAPAPASDARP